MTRSVALLNKKWFASLVLVVAIISIYFQTIFFDYTFLDDHRLIRENFWFISTIESVPRAFSRDVFVVQDAAYYRPLMTLSLIPDAMFAGSPDNLIPFHITNVLLHCAGTVLLFIFFQQLGYTKSLSFVASGIFAVHPLFVQVVAWIPGRNDSLLTLFLLLTCLSWLQFLREKHWMWLVLQNCFIFAALLTKESAVVLPVLLVTLAVVWRRQKLTFTQWWVIVMGWLCVGLLWLLLRSVVVQGSLSDGMSLAVIKTNLPTMLVYLGKAIIPINQSVLQIADGRNVLTGAVVLILLVLLLLFFWFRKISIAKILVGFAWFVLLLIPAVLFHNQAVQLGQDLQLEQRMHAPLIGLLLCVLEIIVLTHLSNHKRAVGCIAVLICGLFSIKTVVYSKHFVGTDAFWDQAVMSSPLSPLAHRNRAAMYQLAHQPLQAERAYKNALALNPDEPMVHGNLGLIAYERGELKLAEQLYRKEIEINPNFPLVYKNLARLLLELGEIDEARELWLRAYRLEPENGQLLLEYIRTFKDSDPDTYRKLLEQAGWSQKDSNL